MLKHWTDNKDRNRLFSALLTRTVTSALTTGASLAFMQTLLDTVLHLEELLHLLGVEDGGKAVSIADAHFLCTLLTLHAPLYLCGCLVAGLRLGFALGAGFAPCGNHVLVVLFVDGTEVGGLLVCEFQAIGHFGHLGVEEALIEGC